MKGQSVCALLASLVLCNQAAAGPNEACAGEKQFLIAQDMVKDQSPMGRQMQSNTVEPFIRNGLSKDFTPSKMIASIRQKGPDRFVDDALADARRRDLAAGADPATVARESDAVKAQVLSGMKSDMWVSLFDWFEHLIVIDQGPVATDYDADLQRVTCTFLYHNDLDRAQRHFDRFSPNSQEARIAAQTNRVQSATGARSTARYTIQPDGRGGSVVSLVQRQ